MFNSVKKKIKFIFIFLVLIILFVGLISILNTYRLNKSINGLISNNYDSVNSINEMINSINNQDRAILSYLQGNKEEALNIFHSNDDEFYKWFYIEKGNITEQGESELVDEINYQYIEFNKLFSSLQDISNGQNHDELVKIYHDKIYPQVKVVIEDLKSLRQINEDNMINKKNELKYETENAIYLILLVSLIGALVGGIIAIMLSNKFFKPINLLVDSISDAIIFLDKNNNIKFINNKGKRCFNIDENKENLKDVNLSEIDNCIKEALRENISSKVIELINNGKKTYFNLSISIIKSKDNEIEGTALVFKDITNLKEIEIVKRNFIGTISHELKTPLTSIMMGVGLISNKNIGSLNEKQKDIVATISEDVHNLSDLVSDLLKLSEVQEGKDNFNIKSNDINEILEETISSFTSKAKEKYILLELSISEKLPYVMIDREKIKWVLNNLISNAIRYTEEGAVKIKGSFDEENIYISVTDTGRGIPREYLKKVFEKFVRVEGFEIPEESTGLGLAIAKEVVEVHGGKIWCESKVGSGSKFTFTIPLF